MGEGDVAGRGRDVGIHGSQEDAIGIEGDGVGCPVEAIFMDAVVGRERQLLHIKAAGFGGIKAVLQRFRRLEDQIDRVGAFVELGGEKFHIDFLGIIKVLWLHSGISAARVTILYHSRGNVEQSPHIPRKKHRKSPWSP